MYKEVYKWIRIEKYKRFESSGYMAILTPVIFRQFASSDVLQSLVILSIQIFSICSIFNRLQEYLIKSFVMDDEQLKNPPVGSSVLERIRDIRASMRRVYLQVICPPADSQPTVSPLRWRCCFTRSRTPFLYDDSIPLTAGEKTDL